MSPAIGAAAAIAVLATLSSQTSSQGLPAADEPPAAVVEAADAARYLFDAARDSNWDEAASQLEALRTAMAALPNDLGAPKLRHSVRIRARELARTVPANERVRTMEAANEIIQSAADLAHTFHTSTPAAMTLLDYYGRQLEIGVAAHRPSLVRRATADMRQAWNELRPELERQGRIDEVRRLTDIVVSLEGTTRAADVQRLARAELDEVQHLEATMR
jgi:hypothetical protein